MISLSLRCATAGDSIRITVKDANHICCVFDKCMATVLMNSFYVHVHVHVLAMNQVYTVPGAC